MTTSRWQGRLGLRRASVVLVLLTGLLGMHGITVGHSAALPGTATGHSATPSMAVAAALGHWRP